VATHAPTGFGFLDRNFMAALEAAQQRLEAALARLEAAAAGAAGGHQEAALREECHRLRRELEAAEDANPRLAAAVEEAERRLDEVMGRLDGAMAGAGAQG
jgi:chromosome segregation ATPase